MDRICMALHSELSLLGDGGARGKGKSGPGPSRIEPLDFNPNGFATLEWIKFESDLQCWVGLELKGRI
jgi:hypothetical protein